MSYFGHTDFLIEVQKGNIPGHSLVHKFGRNDTVANGAWEHISLLSRATTFRSSASTMRVKVGGDVADTSGGAGATQVTIQGIDSAFAETSEVITLAGASASSATTASFWRVHRAWVSAVGTYGVANTGDIVIEDSSGTDDVIMIGAGEGQTQYCGWTVPTGKTAYILSYHIHVDSGKSANIRSFVRENIDDTSADMSPIRLKLFLDGVVGASYFIPRSPSSSISAKSDIWVEAYGDGGAVEVACDFELLVVDD